MTCRERRARWWAAFFVVWLHFWCWYSLHEGQQGLRGTEGGHTGGLLAKNACHAVNVRLRWDGSLEPNAAMAEERLGGALPCTAAAHRAFCAHVMRALVLPAESLQLL